MWLTGSSFLFWFAIPLEIYIDHFHKRRPFSSAHGEPSTVTVTLMRKPPFWRRLLPGLPASKKQPSAPSPFAETPAADERAMPESHDGVVDDPTPTGPTEDPSGNAHPSAAPENPSDQGLGDPTSFPPSNSTNPPATTTSPTHHRVESSGTQTIRPHSHRAGRTSRPHVPSVKEAQAKRILRPFAAIKEALVRMGQTARDREQPGMPSEPPWAGKLKTPQDIGPRNPRPELTRTWGSMARPWGLKKPPGTTIN